MIWNKKTMNEEGGGRTMKMKKILLVALSLMLLLAFGCSHDTNNSSVTNPNTGSLNPKGYVQGKVVDSCTGLPIVGAVIDIGVAKATTNSAGQYRMAGVPATTYVATKDTNTNESASGWSGSYSATIDLTNAYSTADGGKTKVTGYPQYSYDEVYVTFSSLNESDGAADTSTNHDTPVVGLGNGDFDFYVSQMNAGLSGVVVMGSGSFSGLPVAAGYTVKLYSTGSGYDGDSGTGFYGHLIATTTTGVNGTFSFSGLEAKKAYQIEIVYIDPVTGLVSDWGGTQDSVYTACNEIVPLEYPIPVWSTDETCPRVISTSPIMWQDVKPADDGSVSVTFTFSEPILATPNNSDMGGTATGLTASTLFGLWDDVWVNYVGNKKGPEFHGSNVAHTLSWNATMTQLTVTIPNAGVSSVFMVKINDNDNLTDAQGNKLTTRRDGDCGRFRGYEVWFTTYGAATAVAPTLTVREQVPTNDQIDYNDDATLTWTPVVGAKSYNIYCDQLQWDGANTHTSFKIANTEQAAYPLDFSDYFHNADFNFVEDLKIKLSYDCYVVGVNADGIEGAASNVVTIEDVVDPVTTTTLTPESCYAQPLSVTVYFDEPMDKTTVENVANWTLNAGAFSGTAPTITNVVYNVPGMYATINFSAAGTTICFVPATQAQVDAGLCGDPAPAINFLTAGTGMTDVAGNPLTAVTWTFIVNYGGPLCN
jgi:hypothetical protein